MSNVIRNTVEWLLLSATMVVSREVYLVTR